MIGFIGCGNMGGALIEGMAVSGLVKPQDFLLLDQDKAKAAALQEKYGLQLAGDLSMLCQNARVIFVALKPQDMPDLLQRMKPLINAEHTIVSAAAGLSVSYYENYLGKQVKIIRLMPNTPCLVGEGMIVTCKNNPVTVEEESEILRLLEPLGRVLPLDEKYFDAATALSGSGPAYIFLAIEALTDGGVELGLGRDIAQLLAAQTVLGAAKMVLNHADHPAVLKGRITSPGGITSAGLLELEQGAVRFSFIKAIAAGAKRSEEMRGQ